MASFKLTVSDVKGKSVTKEVKDADAHLLLGLQDTEKGLRKRKLIRGNTISDEIFQINCRLDGEIKTEEAPKEEAPKEEAPKKEAKAPKEEAKAPKEEAK